MNYQSFVVGELQTNCYILWSDGVAGIIDPGGEVETLLAFINQQDLRPEWIVNTHGHADHILGNAELLQHYQIPLLINPRDRHMLTSAEDNLSAVLGCEFVSPDATATLKAEDLLRLGNEGLTIIETPGHTRGGISLYVKGLLFAGDTLFQGSVGRTDLPGGDFETIIASIKEKLLVLPEETIVLPGHGESTTIAAEIDLNPFLN